MKNLIQGTYRQCYLENKQMYICYKKTQTQFAIEILSDNLQVFLSPLFNYEDIIYDQPQNKSLCEKLESVQCKTALARTRPIQGTSRDTIYEELGLESLKSRRWYKSFVYSK